MSQIHIGEVAVDGAVSWIHFENLAKSCRCRFELALPQLEKSLLLIARVFELTLLHERRRDAGVVRRRCQRQLRFGLVEHAFQTVGARQFHANIGTRGIEVRRLAQDLEPLVEASYVEIGRPKAQVHVRALLATFDDALQFRDGFRWLSEIEQRQPQVVMRLRQRGIDGQRLLEHLERPGRVLELPFDFAE